MSRAEGDRPRPTASTAGLAAGPDPGKNLALAEIQILVVNVEWHAVKEFRVSVPRGDTGASYVLLGFQPQSRLEASQEPGAPTEPKPDAARAGFLAKFVAHLDKNGMLRKGYSMKVPADTRVVQKCAHIAQELGIRLGYKFSLLENGAFSVDLEADLYGLEAGTAGPDPFAGKEATTEAFGRLVAGRKTEWLEVATFALHEESSWRTADEFAKRRGMIEYDRRTVREAFDSVAKCLGELEMRT